MHPHAYAWLPFVITILVAGRRCSREECLLFSLARKELEPMAHAHAGRDGMIMRQCEDTHISEKRER
jgi:hypothetical protein